MRSKNQNFDYLWDDIAPHCWGKCLKLSWNTVLNLRPTWFVSIMVRFNDMRFIYVVVIVCGQICLHCSIHKIKNFSICFAHKGPSDAPEKGLRMPRKTRGWILKKAIRLERGEDPNPLSEFPVNHEGEFWKRPFGLRGMKIRPTEASKSRLEKLLRIPCKNTRVNFEKVHSAREGWRSQNPRNRN